MLPKQSATSLGLVAEHVKVVKYNRSLITKIMVVVVVLVVVSVGVAPGELIIFQRWSGGAFGTIDWQLYIFKTTTSGIDRTKIPDIYPGVDLLLHCTGATRVKRTLV